MPVKIAAVIEDVTKGSEDAKRIIMVPEGYDKSFFVMLPGGLCSTAVGIALVSALWGLGHPVASRTRRRRWLQELG